MTGATQGPSFAKNPNVEVSAQILSPFFLSCRYCKSTDAQSNVCSLLISFLPALRLQFHSNDACIMTVHSRCHQKSSTYWSTVYFTMTNGCLLFVDNGLGKTPQTTSNYRLASPQPWIISGNLLILLALCVYSCLDHFVEIYSPFPFLFLSPCSFTRSSTCHRFIALFLSFPQLCSLSFISNLSLSFTKFHSSEEIRTQKRC